MIMDHKLASINATQLQKQIGSVLRRVGVGGEHLIVVRSGFPIAVLIPYIDYPPLSDSDTSPTAKIEQANRPKSPHKNSR
ncbi:MAG: type II toxin-antitoxin system prevent-host-death family antitoxin [Anaerolineae bacterium]|nr:type II toxin-antitoxin system prevent-host-death family antitoxin [Anaerolineae bacterium]